MKKILLIIFSMVLVTSIFAQQRKVYRNTEYFLENGDYIVDKDIDKYVGTWEWKSGKDSFTLIILKKEKLKLALKDYFYDADKAIGWFRYIKNGMVVENSLDKQNAIITDMQSAIVQTAVIGNSFDNYLLIHINLKDKKYRQDVRLEFVPGKTDELQWTVYYKDSPTPAKQEYFTIPVNMVLKKVNPANGGIIGGGLGSIIVQ